MVVMVVILATCREHGDTHGGDKTDTPLKKVDDILTAVDPGVKPDEVAPVAPNGDGETSEKPVIPVAEPVPDKPGFVISPYNGKWIDVAGIKPGEVMADPFYPAEEKKYFRVPEAVPAPGVVEPTEEEPKSEDEVAEGASEASGTEGEAP